MIGNRQPSRHPEVGDVISSFRFERAHYHYTIVQVSCEYKGLRNAHKRAFQPDSRILKLDQSTSITGSQVITGITPEGDKAEIHKGPLYHKYDIPNRSRGQAKFVVEHTSLGGGGSGGHGHHDVYPDGHLSRARRLGDDGSYNPEGEVIEFYTSGCFIGQMKPYDVTYYDELRMQQTFVAIER